MQTGPWFLLILIAAPGALAQRPRRVGPQVFDATVFAGYQLNGDATLNGGELEIGDSATYGAAFAWRFHRAASLEVSWEYTKSSQQFRSFSSQFASSRSFDVPTHYFQIGAMHVRRLGSRVEPYFGLSIGAALYRPDTIELTSGGHLDPADTWRFALAVMLGTKIWLGPNVGLRLETRAFGPVVFNSSDIYSGISGAGFTSPSSIPFLQFAFTGGLSFGN